MTTTIKLVDTPEKKPALIIPAVGQLWKHNNIPEIFIRISDEMGKKAIPDHGNALFFSIRLDGSGKVTYTTEAMAENDVVLLEFINDGAVFQQKRS